MVCVYNAFNFPVKCNVQFTIHRVHVCVHVWNPVYSVVALLRLTLSACEGRKYHVPAIQEHVLFPSVYWYTSMENIWKKPFGKVTWLELNIPIEISNYVLWNIVKHAWKDGMAVPKTGNDVIIPGVTTYWNDVDVVVLNILWLFSNSLWVYIYSCIAKVGVVIAQ